MAVSGTLSAVGSGADAVLLSPVVVAVGAGDVYRVGAGGCVAYGCPLVAIFVVGGGGSDSRLALLAFCPKIDASEKWMHISIYISLKIVIYDESDRFCPHI